jgi:hypothetical protein
MTITVKIPLKNGTEITIDGDLEYLKTTMNNIGNLFGLLESAIGEISIGTKEPIIVGAEINPEDTQPKMTVDEVPMIPTDITKNLRHSIINILEAPWGKTPKKLNEIIDVLQTNAIYRSKSSIAGTLTQLVQKGDLRRIKGEDGDWVYLKR